MAAIVCDSNIDLVGLDGKDSFKKLVYICQTLANKKMGRKPHLVKG